MLGQGDDPVAAQNIVINGLQSGPWTTVGATDSFLPATCFESGCGPGNVHDAWFKFTPIASQAVFFKLSTPLNASPEIGNPQMAIWEDAGGGVYNQLACAMFTNQNSYDDIELSYSNFTIGTTYYISVAGRCWGSDIDGQFYMTLQTPPGNDLITDAYPINVDGTTYTSYMGQSFTNLYATNNGSPPTPSCWQFCSDGDVWFKFIAPASGRVQINLSTPSNAFGEASNPHMALWAPDGTTQLRCGSFVNTNSFDDISIAHNSLTPGLTYYISIGSLCYGWSSHGTFGLTVNPNITFDFLEGATIVNHSSNSCSALNAYTNGNASADQTNPTCASVVNKNVWFKFVATTTEVQAYIRNAHVDFVDINKAYLSLWADNGGGGINFLKCASYYSASHDNLGLAHKGLTIGNTYYLSVDSDINFEGYFGLCLFDTISNDFFEGATNLTNVSGICFVDNNVGGTRDLINAAGNTVVPACWGSSTGGSNKWYKFVAPTPKIAIQAKTSASATELKFPLIGLYDAARNLIACGDNGGVVNGTASILYESLTIGNTYYVTVDGGYGEGYEGDYTFCINGDVFFSRGSGDWRSPSTWSFFDYDHPTPSNDYPTSIYHVRIRGRDITVTNSEAAKSVLLTVKNGGSSTNLTIDNGNLLVTNSLTFDNNNELIAQTLKVGNLGNNGTIDIDGDIVFTDVTSGGLQSINLLNASILRIAGNFNQQLAPANYGKLVSSNTATIYFDGSSPQNLITNTGAGGDTFLYGNVVLDNSSSTINLNGPVTIDGDLTFTRGIIQPTVTNKLTIRNANAIGGSINSYVNGILNIITNNVNGIIKFPIGKSNTTAEKIYHPATLIYTNSDASTVTYSGQYVQGSATAISTSWNATMDHISGTSYWQITRLGTSTINAFLSLDFNYTDEVQDLTQLVIASTPASGTPWNNIGRGSASSFSTDVASNIRGNIISNGFSGWQSYFTLGTTGPGNPLPIELTDFRAKTVGSRVLLTWSTLSELNSDRFDIEFSIDGQHFIKVGEVKGQGNSNLKHANQFMHSPQATNTYFYYRLKQIDADGMNIYSEVISIANELDTKIVISAYPNPAKNEEFNIYTNFSINLISKIIIVDMVGNSGVSSSIKIMDDHTIKISEVQIKGICLVGVYLNDGRMTMVRVAVE